MLLNFFYKGISPFLDPVTKDKVRIEDHVFYLLLIYLHLFRCDLIRIYHRSFLKNSSTLNLEVIMSMSSRRTVTGNKFSSQFA